MLYYTSLVKGLEPLDPSKLDKVYKVEQDNKFGRSIIVKQIQCQSKIEVDSALAEGQYADSIHHRNVIKVLDCVEEEPPDNHYVYIVFPLLPRSLQQDLNERQGSSGGGLMYYEESQLRKYLHDLVDVFAELQRKDIAHRDIKPSNILIDEHGELQVIDFGFARVIDKGIPETRTLLGTHLFFSPKLRAAFIEGQNNFGKVQHNVFKSDVYSLGVTMAFLTTLEITEKLSILRDLQSNIDKVLDGIDRYSHEWVSILRRMLIVEESIRPDFLLLQEELSNLSELLDDEDTPVQRENQVDRPPCLSVELEYGAACVPVMSRENQSIPCLLTLVTAPQFTAEIASANDFVFILDVSGSMVCYLEAARTMMTEIVEMLGEQNRVSIVCFSDEAWRVCKLKACTAKGKEILNEHIRKLQWCCDLSSINLGIKSALKVIKRRYVKSSNVNLLIFTDGEGIKPEVQSKALAKVKKERPTKFSVYCFGFGENQDAAFLTELSRNGRYFSVPSFSAAKTEFIACVNCHANVAARNIQVAISASDSVPQGCRLFLSKIEENQENMNFGEEWRILFYIWALNSNLKKPEYCTPVRISVEYLDPENVEVFLQPERSIRLEPSASSVRISPRLEVYHSLRSRLLEMAKAASGADLRKAADILRSAVADLQREGKEASDFERMIERLEGGRRVFVCIGRSAVWKPAGGRRIE